MWGEGSCRVALVVRLVVVHSAMEGMSKGGGKRGRGKEGRGGGGFEEGGRENMREGRCEGWPDFRAKRFVAVWTEVAVRARV